MEDNIARPLAFPRALTRAGYESVGAQTDHVTS
jgi:hypothetical protein